jgi:hypothetical protein
MICWRQFGAMSTLLILALGMVGTETAACPQRVRSLFDLPIETLMQIRIGAELRWSGLTQAEDGVSHTGGVQAEWQGVTRSHAPAPRGSRGDAEACRVPVTWNR